MNTSVRQPRVERREQIARAALQIIGEQGLTSLSTATLAKHVGLSSGGLFRHFESFEEILAEAAHIAVTMLEATFPDPDLPPTDRIRTLALNRVKVLGGNPGVTWLLMSQQARLTLPPESVTELQAMVRRSRVFLRSAVQEGRAEGSIRSDLDPDALLVTIFGTVHTLIGMQGVASGGKQNAEAVMDSLLTMLRPVEPVRAAGPSETNRRAS
ncbi:MAG: TetR/AcrR family transcriptional regulator [Gemmatimonadota bacterium]